MMFGLGSARKGTITLTAALACCSRARKLSVVGGSRQNHLDAGAGRGAAGAADGHGAGADQDPSRGRSDDRDHHTGQRGGRKDAENGEK